MKGALEVYFHEERVLILVILSTILLTSCNKASSPGNADLLEALKTLLNQVHSSSFTYPDKNKAYYQNSSSEITQKAWLRLLHLLLNRWVSTFLLLISGMAVRPIAD